MPIRAHTPVVVVRAVVAVVRVAELMKEIRPLLLAVVYYCRRFDFHVAVAVNFVAARLVRHVALRAAPHIKLHRVDTPAASGDVFALLLVLQVQPLTYHVAIRLLLLAHLLVQIALELRHFLFKPLVDSLLDYLTDDLDNFHW